MPSPKEILMRFLKRIALVFDGTKECHAKVDAAVQRAAEATKRADSFVEERRERRRGQTGEIPPMVPNGHS